MSWSGCTSSPISPQPSLRYPLQGLAGELPHCNHVRDRSFLSGGLARWQVLSEAVRQLHVTDYQRVTIDQQIVTYHGNVAACERLYTQPLPVAYLRHTSRWHLPLDPLATWHAMLLFPVWYKHGSCR